jgi:hypothetical protein
MPVLFFLISLGRNVLGGIEVFMLYRNAVFAT